VEITNEYQSVSKYGRLPCVDVGEHGHEKCGTDLTLTASVRK